jgi:hypothetical protein
MLKVEESAGETLPWMFRGETARSIEERYRSLESVSDWLSRSMFECCLGFSGKPDTIVVVVAGVRKSPAPEIGDITMALGVPTRAGVCESGGLNGPGEMMPDLDASPR